MRIDDGGDRSAESFQVNDYFPEGFDADCRPAEHEIRSQVERILNSEWFIRSARIQRLLTYLVESTLTRQEKRLKESVIGIDVFDRPPDYDPKTDSIVRVEMRRTRSKLRDYYANEGQLDNVLIWLDKGSYIPVYAARTPDPAMASAALLTLTVETSPAGLPLDLNHPASVPVQASIRPWWNSKGTAVSLVAAAALLAGCCGLYFFQSASHPARALLLFPLTGNAGLEASPAFSPDSNQVAYAWGGNRRNLDIFIKPIEGGTPRRLTVSAAHHIHPAWSPDGQRIAFLKVSPKTVELVIIPVTGGVETVVSKIAPCITTWHPDEPEGRDTSGPVWSPDGSYLLVAKHALVLVQSAKLASAGIVKTYLNGREEPLTYPPVGIWDSNPVISPSGRITAFVRSASGHSGDIYVVPSKGGQAERLTSTGRDIQGITWLDEDHILYSAEQGGNFRLYEIPNTGGQPRLFSVSSDRPRWPTLSANGRWLAFVQSRSEANIWQMALSAHKAAGRAQPFLSSASTDDSPAYSPDGKKIVFVSDRTGSPQLWLANSDGREERRLTDFAGSAVGTPRWAPDNRRIVFDASLKGPPAIWLIDQDGSNLHRLDSSTAREYLPNWSLDGQWVYYSSSHDGSDQLWKQSPESGEAHLITAEGGCFNATESPVDNRIYCQMPRGGIWQMPLAGGKLTPVPELSEVRPYRYWALVGDSLYFVRQEQVPLELDVLNLRTRRIRKLADIAGETLQGSPGLAVSPDSQSLLIVQMDQLRSGILLQEQ